MGGSGIGLAPPGKLPSHKNIKREQYARYGSTSWFHDDTATPEFRSPEEEELERKRQELDHLLSELAESELELATLRSELVAFERRYLERVGSRYAELDKLEAQIAESTVPAVQQTPPLARKPNQRANAPANRRKH